MHVRISDTGIGIPEEDKATLFQSFCQTKPTLSCQFPRNFDGHGLELSISKLLLELMGGTVYLESSQNGIGSVFAFNVAMLTTPANSVNGIGDLSGIKALLVDDHVQAAKTLLTNLQYWNMRVTVANASELMTALHHALAMGDPFQVVFVDSQVSNVDVQFLAQTVHSDPDLGKHPPVMILMSRNILDTLLVENRFWKKIPKPIRWSTLKRKLLELLSGHTPKTVTPPQVVSYQMKVLIAEDNVVNQVLFPLTLIPTLVLFSFSVLYLK